MVLRELALAFLLVLALLLLARGQKDLGPKDSGGPMEAGKSGMHLFSYRKGFAILSLYICCAPLAHSAHSGCVGEG